METGIRHLKDGVRSARPFPMEPIRTLDAIHLATAEAVGDAPALVTIVTRDFRIRDNALAPGHPVGVNAVRPATAI